MCKSTPPGQSTLACKLETSDKGLRNLAMQPIAVTMPVFVFLNVAPGVSADQGVVRQGGERALDCATAAAILHAAAGDYRLCFPL